MDAVRFDALTKAWIAETSRRRTLAGLLGGAMGALSLADADDAAAAKSGKCKKEMRPVQVLQQGEVQDKEREEALQEGPM
jgi:hypothetical protein